MGSDIVAVYARALAFARAMPLIVALPFLIELVHQGAMALVSAPHLPLIFSVLGTIGLVCVVVPALRWWRFEGESAQVWRLRWHVLWGVAVMLAIQLTDEILFTTAGHWIATLTAGPRTLIIFCAQLAWLFVSVLLYGWYVAMITGDPISLRRIAGAMRPQWLYGFAVVLGSLIPVLLVTLILRSAYAIDYIGFVTMAFGSAVMSAAIITLTASAYFAIYELARARI